MQVSCVQINMILCSPATVCAAAMLGLHLPKNVGFLRTGINGVLLVNNIGVIVELLSTTANTAVRLRVLLVMGQLLK